ncbi:hypothetical protein PPL_11878 [Heterostelium album PN500]|uniref:COI1 F-box domain-containing protein n=1 Tax=Heterostelium pallidum (strain ATCC 26659 / Pp 5 / PN500) TaxID=670386 RepID=D3BUQ7_HETP5|nr:hypothetical protein PPL_11878 [Heterostelium album PN500]EFA74845.1 hypothetical protein PPL_11878 [Heterostelium album PN500]|eukprot:XP_020426979.1 hypothetical protein PPL_11878 [Heterostelium album PN500]
MEICSNHIDKIFVNLSHLILNKIIGCLDENIDRICFSLVCKRWFNDRDKYLIFNTDNININSNNNNDITQNHKQFKLPSYNNIFNKSIQSKTDCSLFIGATRFLFGEYDFYYDKNTDLKSIPSYISMIGSTDESTDLEYFYQILLESQSVTTLCGCHTLRYGLPKTIKKLSFSYRFNELLVKGSLPSSLEVLSFHSSFKQAIQADVLPEGLLEFNLYSIDYQSDLQPGVFPSSLKTLNLCYYKNPIKAGVLPEKLECLYYSGECTPLEDGVLPKSLKKLVNVPMTWLQAISSLPNLEIIHFFQFKKGISTFNLDLLPSSLKVLKFKQFKLIGAMPTSIKSLCIVECEFQFEEIFPETLQYHFESLQYLSDKILSIPSNVKIDKLIIEGSIDQENCSLSPPSGITSIRLDMTLDQGDGFLRIDGNDQTTLKELRLPYFDFQPRAFIPNTIEELDIGDNSLIYCLDLIKSIDSIKTLMLSKFPKIEIISPESFKTINNIIYTEESNSNIVIYRKLDDNYYLISFVIVAGFVEVVESLVFVVVVVEFVLVVFVVPVVFVESLVELVDLIMMKTLTEYVLVWCARDGSMIEINILIIK